MFSTNTWIVLLILIIIFEGLAYAYYQNADLIHVKTRKRGRKVKIEIPNLLWETIGYSPRILFILEPTNKRLKTSLSHDMSRFHYFLESEFG